MEIYTADFLNLEEILHICIEREEEELKMVQSVTEYETAFYLVMGMATCCIQARIGYDNWLSS